MWDGARDATRYGAAPPQVAPPAAAADSAWDTGVTGEDCLTLNVWTPDPGAGGLPVMVWIQGGEFEFGGQAGYDGRHFARDGVVCVVINWRVGADGFLYLGDGDEGANLGLLDQVASLRWVHDNIAAFGGDPGNVTVFGESAGAMSIGALLAMPRAGGLFRRAIAQSGAAHHAIPATAAARIGTYLAEKLGVPPAREAVAAVPRQPAARRPGTGEGRSSCPSRPWPLGRRGGGQHDAVPAGDRRADHSRCRRSSRSRPAPSAQVDLIAGTNTDDWRLFRVITGEIDQITDQILTGPVDVHGSQALAAYGLPAEQALAAYRARYPRREPRGPARGGADRLVDAYPRHPPRRRPRQRPFGHLHVRVRLALPGLRRPPRRLPRPGDPLRLRHPEQRRPTLWATAGRQPATGTRRTMHAAWMAFATNGDPGWPRYDLSRRATMRFNTTSQVADDPRSWERALWEGAR